jgi:hypothetical protein
MNRASWKRHAALCAIIAAPILAAGSPALAQPKPPPPPPPGAPPAPPPSGDTQKATQYYMKGSELFKAKKFVPALEQFKLSYATVPSPNSHLYIARCLAAIGETRGAWLEFDKVSEEAAARAATEEKYGPTRDSANVERDELATKLGLVTVDVAHAEPGTVLHIGKYDVPRDRWSRPYPVDPGTYEVRVETPNRPVVKSTVDAGPGTRRAVLLDVAAGGAPVGPAQPAQASSKINGLRVAGIAAAGVGVVGFVMFAAGGAASKSTYSSLETTCGTSGGCRGMDVSDQISKGKTQQAIANAGLGLGIAGVAVGTTLIVLSTRKKPADAARPSAELTVGPTWIGAQGTF